MNINAIEIEYFLCWKRWCIIGEGTNFSIRHSQVCVYCFQSSQKKKMDHIFVHQSELWIAKGKHFPGILRGFFHKHWGIWHELICYLSLSSSPRHLGWQWSVKVHNVILCTVISFPMWFCRVGLVTVHLTSDCKRIRRVVNHPRVVILKIKTGMLYHSSHSVLALLTA